MQGLAEYDRLSQLSAPARARADIDDAALANETKPYELTLLFERFEAWLAAPVVFDRPRDQFITVNGVTLQHVDWGGRGDPALFLPGLGDDVHLREQVADFRRDIPRGEAVELRNTDHAFFNDPRIQASVVARIQSFLQQP